MGQHMGFKGDIFLFSAFTFDTAAWPLAKRLYVILCTHLIVYVSMENPSTC